MHSYITVCRTTANGKLLYSAGSSASCSVMPRGVVPGWGRRKAQEGGDMSMLMND